MPTRGIRLLGGCVAVWFWTHCWQNGPLLLPLHHMVHYNNLQGNFSSATLFENQGIIWPDIRTLQTQRTFLRLVNSSQHSVRYMCCRYMLTTIASAATPSYLAAAMCSCQRQVTRSAVWQNPAGSAAPAHAAAPTCTVPDCKLCLCVPGQAAIKCARCWQASTLSAVTA